MAALTAQNVLDASNKKLYPILQELRVEFPDFQINMPLSVERKQPDKAKLNHNTRPLTPADTAKKAS